MFKRAFGLLMLAAALGACDQDPTGPQLEEAPAPAYAVGGASELKNQIVFVDRKPGPASEIWIMRPDGSNRRLLTRGAHPDVSPGHSVGEVIDGVHGALQSDQGPPMLDLAETMDESNNAGCPMME